jgi:hypothetical protein
LALPAPLSPKRRGGPLGQKRNQTVTDGEKMDFWNALGRLYDTSLHLQTACEALRDTAEAHEKRLDRLEVIQQWLAEKERRREIEG